MKHLSSFRRRFSACRCGVVRIVAGVARADETCNSPYMSGLIKGQEDYVHVWTLGVQGLGRRFRQAGDDRRQPELEELRQGRAQGIRGRPRRGASHGVYR